MGEAIGDYLIRRLREERADHVVRPAWALTWRRKSSLGVVAPSVAYGKGVAVR